MQVDPIKPKLKAPKSRRLKLEHKKVLSNCAFNFNLHRYAAVRLRELHAHEAGPCTKGLHSSTFRLKVITFCGKRWVHDSPPIC